MKILESHETLRTLAKALQKPCMFISFEPEKIEELVKAAPYLNKEENGQVLVNGWAYLVFDNNAEMEQYYLMTVGDDGPTVLNNYDGSARIYAVTCNPNGEIEKENT